MRLVGQATESRSLPVPETWVAQLAPRFVLVTTAPLSPTATQALLLGQATASSRVPVPVERLVQVGNGATAAVPAAAGRALASGKEAAMSTRDRRHASRMCFTIDIPSFFRDPDSVPGSDFIMCVEVVLPLDEASGLAATSFPQAPMHGRCRSSNAVIIDPGSCRLLARLPEHFPLGNGHTLGYAGTVLGNRCDGGECRDVRLTAGCCPRSHRANTRWELRARGAPPRGSARGMQDLPSMMATCTGKCEAQRSRRRMACVQNRGRRRPPISYEGGCKCRGIGQRYEVVK